MAETSSTEAQPPATSIEPKSLDKVSSQSQAPRPGLQYANIWARYKRSWVPEALALTLSLACAVAIAIVLKLYDGRPNPSFRLGITLNALISVLATTSKVSLIYTVSNCIGQLKWVWFNGNNSNRLLDAELFDEASRGPLGALKMILAQTRNSIGTFGAILTLLAVAYDPFVQQIVRFEASMQAEALPSSEATASSARAFTVYGSADNIYPTLNSAFWVDDLEWLPTCPSQKCDWPAFDSLAWRSNCFEDRNWTLSNQCNLDVTVEQAKKLNASDGLTQVRNCSVSSDHSLYHFVGSGPWTTDLWLTYGLVDFTEHGDTYDMMAGLDASPMTVLPLYSLQGLVGGEQKWSTLPILSLGTFYMLLQPDWSISLQVITCELDLVLQRHQLIIEGGKTNYTTIEAQTIQKAVGIRNSDGQRTMFLRAEPSSNTSLFSGHNGPPGDDPFEWSKASSCDMFCEAGDALYNWDSVWTDVLSFRTNVTVYSKLNGTDETRKIFDGSDPVMERSVLTSFGNDTFDFASDGKALEWYRKGPEGVAKNLAASLTKITLDRELNANGTTAVNGYTSNPVTRVHVVWPWVTLPFGVCLLGAVFFAITVVVSHRVKAPVWKSSINALFYHGVHDEDYDSWKPLASIPEMDDEAKQTLVKLERVGLHERLTLETQRQSHAPAVQLGHTETQNNEQEHESSD